MKKFVSLQLIFVLLALCGCNGLKENTDTRFLMDTFVSISADTDASVISKAFQKAAEKEKNLSRTSSSGDIFSINNSASPVLVSEDTVKVIERGIYYGDLSGGAFDITLCPVTELWDFNKHIIPSRDEIAQALKNVDYQSLKIEGSNITANGKKIELGGIAKGYIADCVKDFLVENGSENAVINMSSSMVILGKERVVRIKDPQNPEEHCASIKLKNTALSTSGTYERRFEKDGKVYHHILDSKTGYPVESDLESATVIGKSAMDCDALSTICILLGHDRALSLIESLPNTEAVFVNTAGEVSYTGGIAGKNKVLYLK